ncbi:hypothetical protein OZD66_05815, partial [Wolbachia endosymbiont of Drosophila baimaii]|nr:hypothetical protein [Wolbachia endosymbiont of Drosophila baimaii]
MTVVRLAVIQVADTGSFMTAVPLWCHSSVPMMSSQCLTLGWLCCIATYERLTIVRIISNLL